jgi:holo-[acyl-carrier protein] synthase
MSIVSVGTDMVSVRRISKIHARWGNSFAKKILTTNEFEEFLKKKSSVWFLAKRFSAKEACVKALGTGISQGVSFQHIEISNNKYGAPKLNLSGVALQIAKKLCINKWHISLSDEKKYALAFIVATT